jgi:hypothetical protein
MSDEKTKEENLKRDVMLLKTIFDANQESDNKTKSLNVHDSKQLEEYISIVNNYQKKKKDIQPNLNL